MRSRLSLLAWLIVLVFGLTAASSYFSVTVHNVNTHPTFIADQGAAVVESPALSDVGTRARAANLTEPIIGISEALLTSDVRRSGALDTGSILSELGGIAYSTATSPTYVAAVMASGPVAYYHLNDLDGTAFDSSGNGYNLTIGSLVRKGVGGLIKSSSNTAILLPGAANNVNAVVGNLARGSSAIEPTTGISIEAWVRLTSIPSAQAPLVVYGYPTPYTPYAVGVTTSGAVYFTLALTPSTSIVSNATLSAGSIYHIVGTYDGHATMSIYVNGVLDNSTAATGTIGNYAVAGACGLTIGETCTYASGALNGTVDEVAVYATPLPGSAIVAHYVAAGYSSPNPLPLAPTGVSASPGNALDIVSWNAVSGANGYNIYWSTTSGVTTANGTKIAGVTSPYTHSGLTNGTSYYYIVTAINAAGEGASSLQASATPTSGASSVHMLDATGCQDFAANDQFNVPLDGSTGLAVATVNPNNATYMSYAHANISATGNLGINNGLMYNFAFLTGTLPSLTHVSSTSGHTTNPPTPDQGGLGGVPLPSYAGSLNNTGDSNLTLITNGSPCVDYEASQYHISGSYPNFSANAYSLGDVKMTNNMADVTCVGEQGLCGEQMEANLTSYETHQNDACVTAGYTAAQCISHGMFKPILHVLHAETPYITGSGASFNCDGNSSNGSCVPVGGRMQLKSQFVTSTDPNGYAVQKAMNQFGITVDDNGGSWLLYMANNYNAQLTVPSAVVFAVTSIQLQDFQFVCYQNIVTPGGADVGWRGGSYATSSQYPFACN